MQAVQLYQRGSAAGFQYLNSVKCAILPMVLQPVYKPKYTLGLMSGLSIKKSLEK
jgi:hypothetical protein